MNCGICTAKVFTMCVRSSSNAWTWEGAPTFGPKELGRNQWGGQHAENSQRGLLPPSASVPLGKHFQECSGPPLRQALGKDGQPQETNETVPGPLGLTWTPLLSICLHSDETGRSLKPRFGPPPFLVSSSSSPMNTLWKGWSAQPPFQKLLANCICS